MSDVPADLKYLKSHEWMRTEADGTITVGITDHAQEQLGDLVFVELPEVGSEIKAGGECIVLESVKAASDVYSPISGTVTAVNEALEDEPELINRGPYTDGWLIKVKPAGVAADEVILFDADSYSQYISEEDH